MSAPLLDVRKLTLRFGGLTAVSSVDLQVQQGQIAAVIGPNGAGKTSLFNAITGIYEPTEGEVQLDGRDVRQPLERRHLAQWLGSGLLLGLLALLAAAGVDQLWAAVVKSRPPQEFSVGQASRDAWAYLTAQPRIEPRVGKQFVVSSDGKHTFGIGQNRQEAEDLRDKSARLIEQSGRAQVMPHAGGFAVLDGGVPLVTGKTQAEVEVRLQQARELAHQAGNARTLRLFALLAGLGLGIAGAHAVWKRSRRTPHGVARQGVARTFQNIRLFHNMTVLENVLVAMDRHLGHRVPVTHKTRLYDTAWPVVLLLLLAALTLMVRGTLGEVQEVPAAAGLLLAVLLLGTVAYLVRVGRRGAFTGAAQVVESLAHAEAQELLAFVGLQDQAGNLAKNLAYGDQRRLEIARALATRPRLLLLDEPAAGMNPSESVSLMHLIRKIRDMGVTVLLIEHHMRVVMGISDQITVLVHGKRVAHGTPEQIRNDPKVIEAYLGTDDHD